jgi:hypothetical protein
VPLDVPHRAQIMRLCSADSNALEAVYRGRKDELEAAWWQARPFSCGSFICWHLLIEDMHFEVNDADIGQTIACVTSKQACSQLWLSSSTAR